jgi:uncharacterized protein YecE (DUF72 family)
MVKYWYPRGLPARERLRYYAEHFSTVEADSTYYRLPSLLIVQRWAESTPPDFVMHVKAFGLMTRHPIRLEQMPRELREATPVDDRGRVVRPPQELRAQVFRLFREALAPLREAGKLGGILFQLPPFVVWKPKSLDYLEWARDQLGEDRMLVEFRHRSWFDEHMRAELLRWLNERRIAYVTVDAPKVDARNVPLTVVAVTAGLAYVRFHGRNARSWNVRGPSAAQRFDYLYEEHELREWVEPLRELAGQSEEAFALFNNNNQTNGIAQAPAGAELLRALLEQSHLPVG